jgi:hypothetical protein
MNMEQILAPQFGASGAGSWAWTGSDLPAPLPGANQIDGIGQGDAQIFNGIFDSLAYGWISNFGEKPN